MFSNKIAAFCQPRKYLGFQGIGIFNCEKICGDKIYLLKWNKKNPNVFPAQIIFNADSNFQL